MIRNCWGSPATLDVFGDLLFHALPAHDVKRRPIAENSIEQARYCEQPDMPSVERSQRAAGNGLFDRGVRFSLVRPKARMAIGPGKKRIGRGLKIAPQEFAERFGSVKTRYLMRTVQGMTHVVVPDDFAVRGIEERDSEAIEVKGARREAPRVSIGLRQNLLWAKRQLLGLDYTEDLTTHAEGVISRAAFGREFFDRAIFVVAQGAVRLEGSNAPASSPKF